MRDYLMQISVMAKTKLTYSCRACGALSPKWSGQCADCGEWNTLEESLTTASTKKSTRFDGYAGKSVITSIENVSLEEEPRISSGVSAAVSVSSTVLWAAGWCQALSH